MIPIVPALLNAIFDATDTVSSALPVTGSMLKGALLVTRLLHSSSTAGPHGPMEVRDELTMNDFLREVSA